MNATIKGQCLSTMDCGYYHTVALKSNGTFWAWGSGGYGQLGNGSENDNVVQTQVGTATNWQSVSSGGYFTLGVKNNGTLWAAGDNSTGQLGIGSTVINSNVFVQVGTSTNWEQVACSSYFTLALKTNGTLWGWGQNDSFQLGDGTCCSNRLSPVQAGTAADWANVAAASYGTGLAIKTNGTLWGWGLNAGLVGPSTVSAQQYPIQIGTDTDWLSIYTGVGHALALKTNHTLWSWGTGGQGQTGDNLSPSYFRDTPRQIGNDSWLTVAAGSRSSYGIKTDGTLWAWGENDMSQLGDGTTTNRMQPVQIGTDNDWTSVSAGWKHAIALKSNGAMWAWGSNDYGQLGNGTTTATATPVYVTVAGCTLDTPEFERQQLVLSPNPATTEISFAYNGQEVVDGLVIYDMMGREVYKTHPIAGVSIQATLPVHQWQGGVYLLTLKSKGKTVVSKKFVKQ